MQSSKATSFFRDAIWIIMGVASAGFGLKALLLPNHFLDGGVTGVSLLVNVVMRWDVSILLVVLNLPFIGLAYRHISKSFAIKTLLAIMALAALLEFVSFPVITNDKLLIAFFGGFFLGLGIGLAIRGGCVLDGTEVLAIYTSRKSAFSVGDFILVLNILIFGAAAYLINIETALYAILTYLVASKTVDFVVHGIEDYLSVIIISRKSRAVQEAITLQMGRGVTVLQATAGFGKTGLHEKQTQVIYTVITRLELQRLKSLVTEIDDSAFVVESRVNEVMGGMVKRKPLAH